ncbi:hypothetical protein LGT39_01175 [Demequina sp. TTPB684]|uniref:hypothetical protein n=1 Tax=unclassified Demequina TaxID=2620311 RepID=UPI001CF4EE56|nr:MULTISPECIES: hypothetical protein [unclassified Demequina]MCB2411458.1 hypothetical protein [Demequina sp. TTPB684]UPU88326.1 hypothetical protein LGT36_013985 [Demequina sp. TMPB413]
MSKRRAWPMMLSVREARANARAGRWLSLGIIASSAWLAGGVGIANALDVQQLVTAERSWIDAGGYTFMVEPSSSNDGPTRLDSSICDALSSTDGVDGSFAIAATNSTLEPASAPGTAATAFAVSPGVYEFLRARPVDGTSVILTQGVNDLTGLVDGEVSLLTAKPFDDSTVPERAFATVLTADTAKLSEQHQGVYLIPGLLPGGADACYVRTDAAHAQTVEQYLAAALGQGGNPAIVRPRLSANTYGVDFSTAYQDRVLQWSWFAGGLVLAAIWAIIQWTRRTRMAVYATFGAPPRARLVMQFTEWLILGGIGVSWGWGIGMAFSLALGAEPAIAIGQVSGQILALWFVTALGALGVGLLPVGTLLDALKDRS